MKRLVCLSTVEQYEKFFHKGSDSQGFKILCDNERFKFFLDQKGIDYEELTEFDVSGHWNEINTWGWSKAAGFIKNSRSAGFFKETDLPAVIYLWLTVVLILILKNYFLAKKVIGEFSPEEVVVFRSQTQYLWPEYSGNDFFNQFLEADAVRQGLKVTVLEIEGKRGALLPHAFSPLKQKVKRAAKTIIHFFYGLLIRPPKQADVMIYGTLRHLDQTSIELKTKNAKVIFYDDEFRIEHFRFCWNKKITYLIPHCFGLAGQNNPQDFIKSVRLEISRFSNSPLFKSCFSDTYDLGDFIGRTIFGKSMDHYLVKLADQASLYANILRKCDVSALLLDEDFNAHAYIASFMKNKGKQVFCVSHANMALESKLSSAEAAFDQSHTFVQSEHEKNTYIEKGWISNKIVVTGMPRYDRLIDMLKQKQSKESNSGALRILYCAGLLWPYSPDALGFIGWDMYGFKRFQEKSIKLLMEAARGLNVVIVIKPHYAEDDAMWTDFLKNNTPLDCNVQLVKASEDYFRLLLDSDAMALCLWSSTLIEAGIARVPVFYLDPEEQNSRQVKDLAESGLCEIFKEPDMLRQTLRDLIQSKTAAPMPISPEQIYYLGDLDGNAGTRVANFILRALGKTSHV